MSEYDALHRLDLDEEAVELRRSGGSISLTPLNSLHDYWAGHRSDWVKPEESDRWLAPRIHYALRLTRAEASDRAVWHWLAVAPWSDYVRWRWSAGGTKSIAADRVLGPVHKQALARLWWGGELLRDGDNYSSVESAFLNQDLPNSLLHRPVIRCRSLAIGIVQALKDDPRGTESDRINDLARVLNLCTAGSPPEARVDYKFDDIPAFLAWTNETAAIPETWSDPVSGPPSSDTSEQSRELGKELAGHGLDLAGSVD